MKRFLALSMLMIFTIAVSSTHSFAFYGKYPAKGAIIKKHTPSMDQLFVCTAEVPYIYVETRLGYAPAKNVVVVAPVFTVHATSNSPPIKQ